MIEWRPIPDTNYLASSDGEIRHAKAINSRRLYKSDRGYLYVNLWRRKQLCIFTVHKLVALAFYGPRPEGHQVRHLDGNRENNAVYNLEYGTAKENAADRELHNNTARGQRNGNSIVSDGDAELIRQIYARKLETQRDLAVIFKISQSQIHNIVTRKQRA